MPTPAERQALLFVAAVASLGVGVRGCRALGRDAPARGDRVALAAQMAAVDSAVTTGGARRAPPTGPRGRSEPSRGTARVAATEPGPAGPAPSQRPPPAGPVDMDVAGIDELDRLPGIGPALAARIVADREALGPFGSLQALERVKGIGPSLVKKLAPHVTFSLPPRLSDTEVPLRERVARP